jgi:hypothetical protein
MKSGAYVLGCLLAFAQVSIAVSDSCSDLQAAIAKAAVLRSRMQREAAPLLNTSQMPTHHDGACNAAQAFRDHVVVLAKLAEGKCLGEDEQKKLTADIVLNMKEANNNIGLFCN